VIREVEIRIMRMNSFQHIRLEKKKPLKTPNIGENVMNRELP
jgi:hypothetical protein